MRTARLVGCLGLVASLWCASPAAGQHRVRLTNSEHPVAAVPFNAATSSSLVLSPDGGRGAYVEPVEGGFRVMVDGVDQPPYEQIARGTPVFSPDGQRVAYAAAWEGRWYVVVDGEQGEPFDAVVGTTLRFGGARGEHLAYVARRRKQTFVVLDGVRGRPCDAVDEASFAFSPDGERLAYVGRLQGGRVAVVVIGGDESLVYDDASRPVFSADSAHVAYVASAGGREFVVWDNRPEPPRAGIRRASLRLSDGGDRLVYVTRSDRGMQVVDSAAAAAAGEAYAWVFDDSVTLSPGGARLAYAAKRGGACFVVADGKPGRPYDGVVPSSVTFSPDGRRLAYVAERGGAGGAVSRFVVVDGKEGPPFDRVRGAPRFSPNGRRVAYVAGRTETGIARQFVVVDGVEGKPYACVRGEPVFSRDGTRVFVTALAPDDRFAAGEELPWTDGGAPSGRVVLDATERTHEMRRVPPTHRSVFRPDGTRQDPLEAPVGVLLVEELIEDE